MSSVILLGDVHLGAGVALGKTSLGNGLNSRVVDQIKLLDWTLQQADENNAHAIIITGDVFEDPKPQTSLITEFISWLSRCNDYGINVHIAVGNHDVLRSGFSYSSPLDIIKALYVPNAFVYNEISTIYIENAAFTIMPFRDRKSFNVSSNSEAIDLLSHSLMYEGNSIPLDYTKVVVGHFALEGSIPIGDEIDDLTNELFCPLDMFSEYNSVWMGHVHKPQVMRHSNPFIAHLGSMDISNFGESVQKKHIVIYDCINNVWENKDLPTRDLKKISIQVPQGTEDTTKFVLEELKKSKALSNSIVKLEVSLCSADLHPVNRSEIEKYLMNEGTFNIASISESKKMSVVKKEGSTELDTKMDVTSTIKLYAASRIPEEDRSAYIQLATDILQQYKEKNEE